MGLRVMWMSNAPWVGTGYGVQAGKIIPFLKERPEIEDVSLFAFYGIQGGVTKQKVGKHWVDCYPLGADPYGNDVINDWVNDAKSNVLITLLDIFILNENFGQSVYWCPYAPIDHDPLPELFKERFRSAYRPIVYSKFGQRELTKAGIEHWYAPHGVDTKIFKPRSKEWNRKAREWLGLPENSFVVGMVAANKDPSDRKGFNEAMAAFRNLLDKHPDSQLYIHSMPTGEHGGYNLVDMAKHYGIENNLRITLRHLSYQGLVTEDLAKMYNSFDVFLNPCHRAGFEIPLIEAQASGVPIIAGDWHSMTELCGSGWLIEPAQKVYSPVGSFTYLPSVESTTECLMNAYEERGNSKHSQAARDFSMEYDWDYVLSKYWSYIIASLDDELSVRTQKPITAEQLLSITPSSSEERVEVEV